jgi:hypothetical protein
MGGGWGMGNLELGFGACGWWGWDLRLNNYHGTPDKFFWWQCLHQ